MSILTNFARSDLMLISEWRNWRLLEQNLVLAHLGELRDTAPAPLLAQHQSARWWFVKMVNAGKFPQSGAADVPSSCPFGGEVQPYKDGQHGTAEVGYGRHVATMAEHS